MTKRLDTGDGPQVIRPRPRSQRRMWRYSGPRRFVDSRKQAAREAARGRTAKDVE